MSHEEYLQNVKKLEFYFEKQKIELMKRYVVENNPYKIGDKVSDCDGAIIIEKINFSWGFGNKPCAVYTGIELTKKGIPTKRESRRKILQHYAL